MTIGFARAAKTSAIAGRILPAIDGFHLGVFDCYIGAKAASQTPQRGEAGLLRFMRGREKRIVPIHPVYKFGNIFGLVGSVTTLRFPPSVPKSGITAAAQAS